MTKSVAVKVTLCVLFGSIYRPSGLEAMSFPAPLSGFDSDRDSSPSSFSPIFPTLKIAANSLFLNNIRPGFFTPDIFSDPDSNLRRVDLNAKRKSALPVPERNVVFKDSRKAPDINF